MSSFAKWQSSRLPFRCQYAVTDPLVSDPLQPQPRLPPRPIHRLPTLGTAVGVSRVPRAAAGAAAAAQSLSSCTRAAEDDAATSVSQLGHCDMLDSSEPWQPAHTTHSAMLMSRDFSRSRVRIQTRPIEIVSTPTTIARTETAVKTGLDFGNGSIPPIMPTPNSDKPTMTTLSSVNRPRSGPYRITRRQPHRGQVAGIVSASGGS